MIFLSKTGSSYCFVNLLATLVTWSANIVPSAAYYQATGGVYTFSIPSFNGAELRNQDNAQNWCNRNQSKLLEIRNNDIQEWTRWFIASAINKNHMSGNTVITNGRRSNSQFTWVNGNRYNGGLTVYGQESGYSHSYVYIQVTQSGFQFVADTPAAKRSYICEGSSFCSNGFRVSERCYSIIRDMMSWYGARNQCIDRGGDLASFDFINDNTGFNALNGSGLTASTYWIGLTRQNWTWQGSKSEARYSQWSDGHPYYPDGTFDPYEECLCLEPNNPTLDWKWSECDCTQTYQFVCMTGSSTTDLTSLAPSLTSSSPGSASLSTTVDLAIQTRTMHSLSQPSSLSNSGSISTATVANSTPANSYPLAVSNNSALAVGLGVGLGIGIPLTVIILILALMIARLKRKLKSFEASRNIPFDGVSTAATAKEGSAATYESLRNDRQITDNRTYAELNTLENRQNTNV